MTSLRKIDLGQVSLAVHERGHERDPTLILVQGLAQSLFDWPDAFLDALGDAGFRVIAFDNRDVGQSTRFDRLGSPPLLRLLLAAKLGLPWSPRPPYQLVDMAADVAALLDMLDVPQAHLVGLSMGGMIAQRLALARPEKVASLTCVMSTSGAPGLPGPRSDVERLMSEGASEDAERQVGRTLGLRTRIAGEISEADRLELESRVGRSVRHGWPAGDGPARQYAAILADRERWRRLAGLRCPTLIIHGDCDPLLPPEHGRDLAARIPDARFRLIPGMGHEIPGSRVALVARLIADHVRAASERGARGPRPNPSPSFLQEN